MATGRCCLPLGTPFILNGALDRGIPLPHWYSSVFDILLTLLDSSHTGTSYAYADDLIHLADLQQQQADLVCGFCAFTGLKILLSKVEAISINYEDILRIVQYPILIAL